MVVNSGLNCKNCAMECEGHVTSEVRSKLKPKLGLEFHCCDDMFNLYNMYAAEAGFGIRCSTTRMCTMTGEVTRKEYVFCKQGYALTNTVSHKRRRRGCTRTGCKAKLAILKMKDKNKYIVVGFNELSLLEVQVGGLENVGFIKRDVYNYLRDVRGEVIGHDAELLKEHFMAMQEKNESFYFKMEVDSEGRMCNILWSDARSRRAYGFFCGDVVVFDTTFNTNSYGMVFAPLLGINNHQQTVLFDCAFLTSETTDSFVWLLEEFKKAMPGEPPKMIITDQDAAMSKAIARNPTLENVFSEMNKCIWGMDKKEEFDAKWEEIITNNGLQDHAWLSSIHAMRENWVPSYVKHVFSAGMSSNQRAESCHSFFKQYINRKNTSMEFIVRFEKALASQRRKELMADHEILEMFEREDFRSLLCLFELVDEDETHCRYKVSERVNPGVTRMKELVHDKDADKAYCSCKGFEFWGILCRHILAFLRMKQVEHLPDKYILKQWLQSAKSGVIYDKNHKEVNDCVDGFELLEKSFEDIRGKLTTLVSSRAHVEEPNGDVGISYPQLRIKDPHRVKVKGRAKRVKGEKKKAAQRHKRRCTECRKTDHDRRSCPKLASLSSSSDTELGGPVCENLQPTQSTQDSEPTMTESFMQEFDFMYGPVV
ncbi:unnamed protein product [Prunus armeniaca]